MTLIVLGTDTDVGKTVTCATLLTRYAGEFSLTYWKPVATGGMADSDTQTVKRFCQDAIHYRRESYLFDPPVSPHLAAQKARKSIRTAVILAHYRDELEQNRHRSLIVEGAGGLLVPLSQSGTMLADVVAKLNAPVLLVASSRVGTINHTLLTLNELQRRSIECVGVVVCGTENRDNCRAIANFGKTRIIAQLPQQEGPINLLSIRRLAKQFDPRGFLRQFLAPEQPSMPKSRRRQPEN